jgi:hypothetical protein
VVSLAPVRPTLGLGQERSAACRGRARSLSAGCPFLLVEDALLPGLKRLRGDDVAGGRRALIARTMPWQTGNLDGSPFADLTDFRWRCELWSRRRRATALLPA